MYALTTPAGERGQGRPRGLILALLTLVLGSVSTVQAVEFSCHERVALSVVAADDRERPLICEAAVRAVDFLAGYGLQPRRQIVIEIVEEPITSRGYDAYGSYDSRIDVIRLMSPAAIRRSTEAPTIYNEPLDDEHYRGAVAHEIAHAVVQHNMAATLRSPAPQEYLAHATQLAVLPESRRNRIIARANVGPWESGDAISDVYMALEPTGFAVKSFLHLTALADPPVFINILLTAKWFYVSVP